MMKQPIGDHYPRHQRLTMSEDFINFKKVPRQDRPKILEEMCKLALSDDETDNDTKNDANFLLKIMGVKNG